MADRFDAFVLFAEMRTGSNHLEESLNALDGVQSFGEVFNPVFLGSHNRTELFGIDMAAREADPAPLLDAVVSEPGLTGFRFFHDHDPRVLDEILDNPRIAKVVLTRNPLDSYVSLAIASQTGQWRLTNPKMAKAATARFVAEDFDALIERQMTFRDHVQRRLQVSGQGAFWIAYDDIGDLDVLNGLAAYLGAGSRLAEVPGKLKRQNPGDVEDKVENPGEMRAHLATLDPFLLTRSVNVEPPRGPAVPTLMAAADSPLLALPLPGGPTEAIRAWLTVLDGAPPVEGMTQKDLRPWMRKAKGFVSFAIVRHPLLRAYRAFERMQSGKGNAANTLRRVVANQHGVDPDGPARDAFLGFLKFLKANLNGQSSLPVAPEWASQAALLSGMAQAVLPQRLIREEEAAEELARLAGRVGRSAPAFEMPMPADVVALLDSEVEDACIQAYRRDFLAFGFKRWKNS
ncbi:nodulation protein NodH [Jannaschia marina]|uniref:nodulation protein NodH n=1 Tax=Jannaschia marina TaxID=2741674 RepID=UPI0015CEC5CA|nr:nodulation protein NodH [Jannaschia marina]